MPPSRDIIAKTRSKMGPSGSSTPIRRSPLSCRRPQRRPPALRLSGTRGARGGEGEVPPPPPPNEGAFFGDTLFRIRDMRFGHLERDYMESCPKMYSRAFAERFQVLKGVVRALRRLLALRLNPGSLNRQLELLQGGLGFRGAVLYVPKRF